MELSISGLFLSTREANARTSNLCARYASGVEPYCESNAGMKLYVKSSGNITVLLYVPLEIRYGRIKSYACSHDTKLYSLPGPGFPVGLYNGTHTVKPWRHPCHTSTTAAACETLNLSLKCHRDERRRGADYYTRRSQDASDGSQTAKD